jgi:hypothetical protein
MQTSNIPGLIHRSSRPKHRSSDTPTVNSEGPVVVVGDQPAAAGHGVGNGIHRRAKSDAADAHLLAKIVRLSRACHRRIAGDCEITEHVKIATRAPQTMIW